MKKQKKENPTTLMHRLFTGNPVDFLCTSGGCRVIHVIAERCQERVSMITRYLHLSRLQISFFQVRLLPAKFCPGETEPGPSACYLSFIWKLPRAPRLTQAGGGGFSQGLKGEDLCALKGKDLAVVTSGNLSLKE